jgi:cytoskeleton protein RodZ
VNGELDLTRTDNGSIGQRLRERRETAGLSIEAAAAKLYCDASIITALEADRFDELGAPVFAQGHLRRYAELVGAPVTELLAEWAQRGARVAVPDLTRIPRAPSPALDREVWGRRLGALAGAVVIAVAAWWILQGGAVQTPPAAPAEARVAEGRVAEGRVAEGRVAEVPAAASPTGASPVAATAPSSTTPAPAVTDTPMAASLTPAVAPLEASVALPVAASAATARLALSIEVRENCWTEVYDADGRKLYFDTLRAGNRAAVTGAAPLRVLLGRADRASLTIDGRPVAIPTTLIRNTTAYFTVDAAAQLQDLPRPAAVP